MNFSKASVLYLRVLFAVALVAAAHLASNIAAAQPAPPEQQPANAPERSRVAIAATLYLFISGLSADDHAVVSALLWSDDDPQRLFVDAAARKLLAQYRLGSAMSRNLRLDAHECLKMMGEFGLRPPDPMTMLAAQHVYADGIVGDRAKVQLDGKPLPPLRNVKGIWKIDVTSHNAPGKAADRAATARREADALDRLSKELGAAKHAGIGPLRDALIAAGFKQLPEDQRPDDD